MHTNYPRQNVLLYVIQLYLRSGIGLWGKYYYYYTPFDTMHYFFSIVGFANIVVWSTGESGVNSKMKYGMSTVRGQCMHTHIHTERLQNFKISQSHVTGVKRLLLDH